MFWRHKVGLEKFLQVASVIVQTCPSDPNGYHTAPASDVMALPYEMDMDGEMFWDLLGIYITKLNISISSARKAEKLKLEQKRRRDG